jgi:RNA polymerase sigma-70 factor, ECF subfamily
MNDADLAHGLRQRDPTSLAALVDAYADPVYRLVRRILAGAGRPEDVEECANDVFVAAWERIDRFDPARAPLRTWLLMLAKYEALRRRRALGHGPEVGWLDEAQDLPGAEVPPEEALARREERQAIQTALNELPPIEKQLVYRRYFLGERVDRLAAALGLTRQAADNRLWRARQFLREKLLGIGVVEVTEHDQ